MKKPLIEVNHLYKSFGDKVVLKDINFVVYERDALVILGPSGTGKSVLFKCMLGLLTPTKGNVYINGKKSNCLSERKRLSITKGISMVFQGSALFDSHTILENIVFGLVQQKKLSKSEQIKIATEALEKVNLDASILNVYPTEISGGMQKRVALARAITTRPQIIFFDEPTTGLDPVSSAVITNLINRIKKEFNITTITITHDIKCAMSIANRIILLNNSTVAWQGSIEEAKTNSDSTLYNFINGVSN